MKISATTVGQLHRALARLIKEGHKRAPVCIDKPSFQHPLEGDGCSILHITGVRFESVPQIDDDGGMAINKDGTEKYRRCAVIFGDKYHIEELSPVQCTCGYDHATDDEHRPNCGRNRDAAKEQHGN